MEKIMILQHKLKWLFNIFLARITRVARTSWIFYIQQSCTGFVNSSPYKKWKLQRQKGLIRWIELESLKVLRLKNKSILTNSGCLGNAVSHDAYVIQIGNSGKIKMAAWDSHMV